MSFPVRLLSVVPGQCTTKVMVFQAWGEHELSLVGRRSEPAILGNVCNVGQAYLVLVFGTFVGLTRRNCTIVGRPVFNVSYRLCWRVA